jgi:hypothetical protein
MQVHSPVNPSTMARNVTLYIPGLFAGTDAPAKLKRLLARADQSPGGAEGETERLFALFGIAPAAGQDLPVAAVTRVIDMGVIDSGWWIRADPVYLEAGRDNLVMHTCLGLSLDEAKQLVKELNESLTQDGWRLKAPKPDRWYLKPPAAAAITTTPLSAANGRNVHPLLPRGPDYRAWHTRLNELQILLHTSPVNVARASRGQLPVNSVWFWGGGQLPQPGPIEWVQIVSDDPLSLGLARLSGVPGGPVPVKTSALNAQPESGAQLLVLRLPAPILSQDDADTWQSAIQTLVDGWLSSLLAAVHSGELSSLTLVSDSGPKFLYHRAHRWRFWRRLLSLSSYRAA